MRGSLIAWFAMAIIATMPAPAEATDGRIVVVEFQPATDDDAGLAYLLYSTVSESLANSGRDELAAGEDVEMYLGSAAADCHRKRSCLDKLAERFDASAALMATIDRDGLEIGVTYAFVSLSTGNVLEQGKRVYQAGEETSLTQLILDKLDGVLSAAEDEEGNVGDGGEAAVAMAPPAGDRQRDRDRETDARTDEQDRSEASHYSAREYERSVSAERAAEKQDRQQQAEAARVALALEREERFRRESAERENRYSRESSEQGDRSTRERDDRSTRERDDRSTRERDDRATSEREDRDRRDRDERDRREREEREQRERERVRVRDLGDGEGATEQTEESGRAERKATRTTRRDSETADQGPSERTVRPPRERRRKHPEDAPSGDPPLIDPVLLETFDSADDAMWGEEGRSGTTRLTREEAAANGIGAAEYRAYVNSGLTFDGWSRKRYDHKGRFHLRFAGFYALGGLDMYYSVRVVREASEILETYYWQSYGFRALSGGGTFGLGFGVAPAVDLSAEVSLFYGEQWLLREWRTPDRTTSTIGSIADPPVGSVLHFLIAPKARFYLTPFKPVKPYGGFGFALIFMPGFDVPEEWAPDRPGSFVLGLEPTLGVQFDTALGIGIFIEAPFTGYVGSDHGVESGLVGEGAYLTEEEKNDPPSPVPRYMLRAQVGIQIRI